MAAVDHAVALDWTDEWRAVDVVIVDAADEGQHGDHFPGVEVVRQIRACQADPPPVVIVVTGHFMNDGLRFRMAKAGADFYFFRGNLRSDERLLEVVLHPERFRRGVPPVLDAERQRLLGISDATQVDELLGYAREFGLADALDPDDPTRDEPRGRHWLRHRKALADAGHVDPVNITTGDPPRRNQKHASWRQLRAIYGWSARVQEVDDGSLDEK